MDIIGKKYKLLEKIGEGSFGLIFKGQNIRTGELVAIKMELGMNAAGSLTLKSNFPMEYSRGVLSNKWLILFLCRHFFLNRIHF